MEDYSNTLEKLKKLYVLTEMKYLKDNTELSEEELFPIEWYSSTDYIKKIEILGEAIKKKTLIINTEKYKEFSTTPKIK